MSVCEDEDGFLWVGTDHGISRFNGFNWQNWDIDNGLPGNYVKKIQPDKHGGLWLLITNKGAYHFDILLGKFEKIDHYQDSYNSKFEADRQGNLFSISTTNNTTSIKGELIEPGRTSITVFEYTPDSNFILFSDIASHKVFALYSTGTATDRSKLNYKGPWPIEFRPLPYNSGSIYTVNDSLIISNKYYIKYTGGRSQLNKLDLFAEGNAYAYNFISKQGIYIYDQKTGYYFISNAGKKEFHNQTNGLGSDYVSEVYELKDGTILFATLGAGLQWIKKEYNDHYSTGGMHAKSIIHAANRWYVLAGEKILTITDDKHFQSLHGTLKNSSGELIIQGDQLLVGSLRGIDIYPSARQLVNPHFIQFNTGISSILPSVKGFVASTYGNGMISFNDKSTGVTKLPSPMMIIEKAVPLKSGYALMSYEEGVILRDTIRKKDLHLTRENGLLSNGVYYVHEYRDTQYICCKNGINLVAGARVVETLSYEKGFVGAIAKYCFHDPQGRFWVLSDEYLHLYENGFLRCLRSYPLFRDGEKVAVACYDPLSNTLTTGSDRSISITVLSKIIIDKAIFIPRILRLMIDGIEEKSDQARVKNDFKKLSIEIAPYGASPFYPGTFFYKLDGINDSWKALKDSLTISYESLRPGNYKLWAKIINSDGYEGPEKVITTFVVNKPFWQKNWFLLLLQLLAIIFTYLVLKKVEMTKNSRIKASLALQETLQKERERISKDLHDHLGSNLVTIVAQVDNLETKLQRSAYAEASKTVLQLSFQTREIMTVLRETIWAVNENEHTLESFIIRIRTFLQRLFENSPVTWHVNLDEQYFVKISPNQSLQLFRILQEASQNIHKHSKATEAHYDFIAHKEMLYITIRDNGIGFNGRANIDHSSGLINIQHRVAVLKGEIEFQSSNGAIVVIKIPIKEKQS